MRYDVLYVDPPWSYNDKKTGGSHSSSADQKYRTMSFEDIYRLPVRWLAAPDSVLFLWVTVPLLPEGIRTLQAWGFEYKTCVFWEKSNWGMGHWFRGRVEMLLLGVRGNVAPFKMQELNLVKARTLRHSEKPAVFREMVERATAGMPSQNRLEMFARCHPAGWDVFGNEVEGSIDLPQTGNLIPATGIFAPSSQFVVSDAGN